jgi:hypothetical protein
MTPERLAVGDRVAERSDRTLGSQDVHVEPGGHRAQMESAEFGRPAINKAATESHHGVEKLQVIREK